MGESEAWEEVRKLRLAMLDIAQAGDGACQVCIGAVKIADAALAGELDCDGKPAVKSYGERQ